MQPADLVTKINQLFTEKDASQLIAALRQDELVWEALQDELLSVKLVQESNSELLKWTPAAIFCQLESLPAPEDLKNLSLGVDGKIKQTSIQNYEAICRNGKIPENLSQAGFAAMALRERRKLINGWENFADEIEQNASQTDGELLARWKTIIAILIGLTPDNESLFSELLSLHGKIGRELVSHAVLSVPSSIKDRVNVLSTLMIRMELPGQIDWLQSFALRGELVLSEQLARLLIANSTSNIFNGFLSTELSSLDLPQVAAKAVRLQQAATLFQLAGKEIEADRFLSSAAETLSYLTTGIRLQQSGLQTVLPNRMPKSVNPSGDEDDGIHIGLQGELLLAAATGKPKTGTKSLPGKFGKTFRDLYEAAKIATAGDLEKARELAAPTVEAFMQFISSARPDYSPKFLINWQPEEFIDLLVNLNYLKEAGVAAEWFLRFQPTNDRLLALLGDLFNRNDQPERAAKSLSLAVSINPNKPENRRLLAKLHETNGQFQNALEEWKRIIELEDDPKPEDLIHMARAAFKAEKYAETIDICKSIVEEDPFNGLACSYWGQAAAASGDNATASEHMQKSILLAPDNSEVWLALSRFQKQNGDLQKAYETLRSASFSLPDSSEINLELALLSMETGRPSEALPHLRLAASKQPENLEVASMLSNALVTLGHNDEALELLNTIRKRWPEDVSLARTHGLLLHEAGNFLDAVEPLKAAIRNNGADEEAAIKLCLAQLETSLEALVVEGKASPNINLAEAAQIITNLISKVPESIRGHLLLGALYFAMGDLEEAFDEFRTAVDQATALNSETKWIAQGGLGRTALALNRPEVALAVLDEATAEQPKNLPLQRLLVPAYIKANLPQEAIITAQHAVDMAPDDVENLVWYAKTMLEIGNKDEAVKTVRRASDCLNGDASSLISLAALGLEVEEHPAVRKSLLELNTLPNVNPADLTRAAEIQILLGDHSGASENLSRAIKMTNSSNPKWLFEQACLQKSMGDISAAQETVKQAIAGDPLSAENWLIQADLFAEQGRHQSALESLEKALSLSGNENAGDKTDLAAGTNSLFSRYREIAKAEIHNRFAQIMYFIGNLTGALVHAEQALELEPQNLEYRLQAARLAESLILTERAVSLAEIPADQEQLLSLEDTKSIECDIAAELHSIKAGLAINENNLTEAEELFQKIIRLSPTSFVKENIEIRLMAKTGNIHEVKENIDSHVVQHLLENRKAKKTLQLSGISVAALEAALVVERWDLAEKLASQIVANNGLEPAAHLALAKTLVRSGEEFIIRKEMGIQKHLPDIKILDQKQHERFEAEINIVSKQSNSKEVGRWQKRGLLIFGGKAGLDKVSGADFTSSEDQAAFLQALRCAGRNEDAISFGEQFEESPQILLQMGLAYADKNPRIGLDLCLHINELQPANPISLVVSAKLAELSGETGIAVDFLNEALQQYDDEPGWRAWLSNLLAKQKDFDNAAHQMEEALSHSPESAENWEALGKLYIQNKQNHQAIHAFSKAVELNPGNPEVMLSLAASYRAAGEIQDALDCIEKAIDLNVKPEHALLLRGEISRDLGNLADSIDFSRKALKANPNSMEAYLFLAQTQRVAGKAAEANETIEQAISTLGSKVELLIEKAKIVHSFKGARNALPLLQGLASQYPGNEEILAMLAKIQAELGDLTNAEHTALESLKIQPNQPELNIFVGKLLRKSGQLDKAIHHFGKAVEQSHLDLDAIIELAQTHQEQREYDRALEAYQTAIQIAPRDIRAYTGAAGIYRESKDYSRAEDMLRRAAEIDPGNLAIKRQLGAVVALNLVHTTQEAKSLA